MTLLLSTLLLIAFGVIYFLFGMRLIIFVVVSCLLSWWLCDIEPMKEYTWYSGIWHGIFFVGNFIRSLFSHALYKADFYTTGYNIWWWIATIHSVGGVIFGGCRR